MRWYFEVTDSAGNWCPRATADAPRIVKANKIERLTDGTGPRIRGLKPIHPDHAHLTLGQLANVYGTEAKFATCQPPTDPQRPGYQAEDSGNS